MIKLEVGKFYKYNNLKLIYLAKHKGIYVFWGVEDKSKAFLSKYDIKNSLKEWQEPGQEISTEQMVKELWDRVGALERSSDMQNERVAKLEAAPVHINYGVIRGSRFENLSDKDVHIKLNNRGEVVVE